MNKQIEIEYKILLTENIFNDILKYYPNHKDYIQTNYYFTHPLLQQKKYMLRIREKNNTFEMTLKKPLKNHRLEMNVDINQKDKDDFIQHLPIQNEIIDILKQEGIDIKELQQQFSLTTHRYDIILDEGVLSLDDNTYLNQHDYELEFECYDETVGFQKFLEIIKPYHLDYQQNCMSKVQRALKAYHENDK